MVPCMWKWHWTWPWIRSNNLCLCWHVFMFEYICQRREGRERETASPRACQGFRLCLWHALALWSLPVCLSCHLSISCVISHHHCVCLSLCLSAPRSLPLSRSCCSSKLLNVATQNHFSPGSSIRMTPLFWNRLCLTSRASCHFVSYSRYHLLNGQFVTHSHEYALCPMSFSFLIAILELCVAIYLSSKD